MSAPGQDWISHRLGAHRSDKFGYGESARTGRAARHAHGQLRDLGGVRCVRSIISLSEKISRGGASAISLPFHITNARFVTWAISGMSWDTQITVLPRSPRRKMSRSITLVLWSWPVVGSSRINTCGRIV